jgi:DNA repair protein RadC
MTSTVPPLSFGPRERLLLVGEERLSDAECIALILRTGVRGEGAEQLGARLLREFGGIRELASAEVREVARTFGVGPVRAAALGAAFGLARRLTECRYRPGTRLASGREVALVVRETVRDAQQECVFALLVDARHRLLSLRLVSTGGLDGAYVHPRDVFRAAIREGAAAIVLAHNHPSGDPTPSEADALLTERMRQSGELLGIAVLDHVVVGAERYYSFADQRSHEVV